MDFFQLEKNYSKSLIKNIRLFMMFFLYYFSYKKKLIFQVIVGDGFGVDITYDKGKGLTAPQQLNISLQRTLVFNDQQIALINTLHQRIRRNGCDISLHFRSKIKPVVKILEKVRNRPTLQKIYIRASKLKIFLL